MADHAAPGSGVPWRTLAGAAGLVMLLVVIGTAVTFRATGGRFFVVASPSMGTAAPVGTLVLTRPVAIADVRVGDVIAFHPPIQRSVTYTHRVVARADGRLSTRGDINGAPDPWRLTGTDLVGRAVTVLPGLGWLVRALPLLVLGWALVGVGTRYLIRPALRGPARLAGGCLVVLVAALRLRPLVGIVQLTTTTAGGVTSLSAVSTGLLPTRLLAQPGGGTAAPLDLGYGGTGVLRLTHPGADGRFALAAQLHLDHPQTLLLVLVCCLPMLFVLIVGFRPVPVGAGAVGAGAVGAGSAAGPPAT